MKNYISFVKNFLKNNKDYIFSAFIFLFLSILFLLVVPIPEYVKSILIEQAKQTILWVYSDNSLILMWNIFKNNAFIGLLVLLSGFLMSLFALLVMFWNVMIMFIVVPLSVEKVGVLKTILALFPHWVLEISAVLLSVALAFKITVLIFKKIWNWKQTKIIPHLKEIFRFRLVFVFPLFFVAAFVEAFITPLFL